MFQNKTEQVSQVRFDLQFFAEPGGEPASPPATDPSQNVATPDTTSQATGSPDVTGSQSTQRTVTWDEHQAAIKGMNEAQRKAAELEKRAAYADQIDSDPITAVKQFLSQNPDALTALLRENPMQTAQIMGQVFNNQQPQASPYENITTYDEFGNAIIPEAVKAVDQKYNPRLTAVENFIQRQYEDGIKARENGRIPEAIRDTVWNAVKQIGIPMQTIEAQPWLIDGLIIQASGGREKYEEQIYAQRQTKKVNQVIDNHNSTVNLIPNGSVAAVQTNTNMSWNDRKKLAARQVAALNQT